MGKNKKADKKVPSVSKAPQKNEAPETSGTSDPLKSKPTIVALIFGVLLTVAALVSIIFFSLTHDTDTEVDDIYVSSDEMLINSIIDRSDKDIESLDDSDLADFEDSELAADEAEAELDQVINDLDQLLEELDQVDNNLGDFNDGDISL